MLVVVTGDGSDAPAPDVDVDVPTVDVTATAVAADGDDDDELSDESCVKTKAGGFLEPLTEDRPRTQVWPREGGPEAEMVAAAE